LEVKYECSGEKAAEIASRACLLVASGIHLPDYLEKPRSGDERAVVDEALADLVSAARVARAERDPDAGIGAAAAYFRERLGERRDRPGRNAQGRAMIDRLLDSVACQATSDVLCEVVAYITGRCEDLYGDYWPEDTRIAIATRGEHPRNETDPYGITALTKRTADAVEVRLQIHVDSFGPHGLAALAGAVAHECVCHVAARPHGPPDNESAFAEGFMDWAATYYLQTWTADLPGELGTVADAQSARHREILLQGSSPPAVARKGGRRAAQRLANCLQRHHGKTAAEACAVVAAFGARLNTTEARLAKKDSWTIDVSSRRDAPLDDEQLAAVLGFEPPEFVL
jgi:hypothetical protein